MKLQKVNISGFRSIEKMEFPLSGNGHKVLVGRNESGKSNILNALNLLSANAEFETKDKKLAHYDVTNVVFSFDLEEREIDTCRKIFCGKFVVNKNTMLTTQQTIEEFCNSNAKNMIYVVSPGFSDCWSYWKLKKNIPTKGNWYLVNQNVTGSGYEQQLPPGKYINDSFIKSKFDVGIRDFVKHFLTPVDTETIYDHLHDMKKEAANADDYRHPIHYWRYRSKEHDMTTYKNIEEFSQNPNCCEPLKNMFLLAGFSEDDIGKVINEECRKGRNEIRTLLNEVAKQANDYIGSTWKEFGNAEIELRKEDDDIAIGIEESKHSYDYDQRSDGFRRLISFLLLIGTGVDKKQIRNALILIDEPETGLHPSGAKDLRNKLIELGKENMIVYATHSISMIDAESIENNYIVTRENETTKFEIAKESGASPAENIYQAIGHSIYDDLKKKNIILEGYTDKKLLKYFMADKYWENFGICYMRGVTSIKPVLAVLDLADRKYFILSDADEKANQEKKELENSAFWYTYKDLNCEAITLEDFYKEEFFYGIVKEVLQQYGVEAPDHVENNRMLSIRKSLYQQKEIQAQKENVKIKDFVDKILHEIKIQCAHKSKKENAIKEKVESMLTKLKEKLNGAK